MRKESKLYTRKKLETKDNDVIEGQNLYIR